MAIEKFKNEIGTDLNAYKIVKEDGTSENVKLLRNANITRAGTPLNEDTLNPIVDELNANTSDLTNLKSSVSSLKAQQETNTQDITDIKETNTIQDEKISTNIDNISYLQTSVSNINSQLPNKADLIDGKLPVSQLPSTGVVADKANSLVYGTGQEVTGDDVIATMYNLGAYDTYVSNGDGTGTITRQTGYLNTYDVLDGLEPITDNSVVYRCKVNLSIIDGLPDGFDKYVVNNNTNYNKNNPYSEYSPDYAVAIVDDLFLIRGTTINIDDIKEYLSKHILYIQYKLATSYTETVIENVPLLSMPKQGIDYLKDKWTNNINLSNASGLIVSTAKDTITIIDKIYIGKGNPMSLLIECTNDRHSSGNGGVGVWHGDENFGGTNWTSIFYTQSFYKNENAGNCSIDLTNQIMPADYVYIIVGANDQVGTYTFGNVIVNIGDHILPYVPYYDNKYHITNTQKTLLNEIEENCSNLFDLNNAVNKGWAFAMPFNLEANQTYIMNAQLDSALVAIVIRKTIDSADSDSIILRSGDYGGNLKTYSRPFTIPSNADPSTYRWITFHINMNIEGHELSEYNIMLNKGTQVLPYQPYKGGSVAYVSDVLTKSGENDVDDDFILQSKLNGAKIEFAENDIMLTTNKNQTSVNEILNRLDKMGFKWGSVHLYGNTDSTNSPTIKLAKSGAIAILQVSGIIHGSLYSSTAPHLYLTITDEDFFPVQNDNTFIFTYTEKVGQVTGQTWSTGSVNVNYREDAGESNFENITFDLIEATTTEGNRYKTNISFTYAWFVRIPPTITNATAVINEVE